MTPGKNAKHISSSDKFVLTPTRRKKHNKQTHILANGSQPLSHGRRQSSPGSHPRRGQVGLLLVQLPEPSLQRLLPTLQPLARGALHVRLLEQTWGVGGAFAHWLRWPKKSPNFIFSTKMVFPKSLKFMNSGSELGWL